MKCFKWRVKKTAAGDVVLRERPIDDQQVVAVGDSVSLRSPGLDKTPNYKNRMFCLYNISISDCNSIHVQSVTEGDQEYKLVVNDDNSEVQHDYLYLDFGQVHSPVTLYGYDVSDFSTSVYTSSFYAVRACVCAYLCSYSLCTNLTSKTDFSIPYIHGDKCINYCKLYTCHILWIIMPLESSSVLSLLVVKAHDLKY